MDRPASEQFDLIVIGAGCNGAGIARDAAMRGLRVLLLDKGDVGGETTSWSSRLIHGGLRYLEHGEISLVRQSLRERSCLLSTAGHLVKPLPMLIPVYRHGGRPKWKIRLGLIGYDLMSWGKTLQRHRMLRRDEVLDRVPGLHAQGLCGGALYYDAQVEYPERLVLENVLSARSHGATIRTYCRVERFLTDNDAVVGVAFTDTRTGLAQTARSPVTVNATGPWADRLLEEIDHPRLLQTTKGSHLVVGRFDGAADDAIYTEAADRRPIFIIPWNDQILIGTTDTVFDGEPGGVRASRDEIEYLLDAANRVLPRANLTGRSIHYTYAGIRPLAHSGQGPTAGITRQHVVHRHGRGARGLLSVVGGKLTTYRSLAESVVDEVFELMGQPTAPCATASSPLPGSHDDIAAFGQQLATGSALPLRTCQHLVRVYGRRAGDIESIVRQDPSLAAPVCEHTGAIAAEIVFAFREELAVCLSDCLRRRTMIGLSPSLGLDCLEAVAAVAQNHLGWDPNRARQEVEQYRQQARLFLPSGSTGSFWKDP